MWDLKSFSKYTLCSQEKNYVFLTWDKKHFDLNISTEKNNIFLNNILNFIIYSISNLYSHRLYFNFSYEILKLKLFILNFF
jgi:hypothetical protein